MIVADGGDTQFVSTSSGTTNIGGYTTIAAPTTDISQQGTGTTQVSSGSPAVIERTAGTLKLSDQVTILSSIGTLSFFTAANIDFIDNFGDASIYRAWASVAGGGSVSEASDVLTCSFATGGNAQIDDGPSGTGTLLSPRVWMGVGTLGNFTALAVIKTLTFTTPNAGYVLGGMAMGRGFDSDNSVDAHVFGRYRDSAAADTLRWITYDSDGPAEATQGSITLSQNTSLWLMFIRAGDTAAAYYRTTAPTSADNTFTLLASASATGAGDWTTAYTVGLLAGENGNNAGAVTADFEKFQLSWERGPG